MPTPRHSRCFRDSSWIVPFVPRMIGIVRAPRACILARVAGDAPGLHDAYIYGLICVREEQGGLLVGAGVLNPCLLFVYNSPLLARCNVVMKPVPDCIMSHDAVELGVYAVLYVVLMHSGTT